VENEGVLAGVCALGLMSRDGCSVIRCGDCLYACPLWIALHSALLRSIARAKPFEWKFSRDDLNRLLNGLVDQQSQQQEDAA